MIEQEVQWVVLPAGPGADDRLALSVVVAPRLRSDEGDTLAVFPDFVDWPTTVVAADLAISTALGDIPATVTGEAPDSALWAALFPPETRVIPYEFDDYADRPLVSYSVTAVTDELRRLYARVAAASADRLPPKITVGGDRGLDRLLGPWRVTVHRESFHVAPGSDRTDWVRRRLDDARSESRARRAGPRGGSPIEPLPADGNPATELERLVLFHSRPTTRPTSRPTPEDYRDQIDFHQLIGALGDHPWLARRLGLVLDVSIERAALADSLRTAPGRLALRGAPLAATRLPITDSCPPTAYVLQRADLGLIFAAATRDGDPADPARPPSGLRPLPGGVRLSQVDVDGAALKTLNLAVTVETAEGRGAEGGPLHEPADAGLAALRTAGISLVETDRAASLQSEFGQQVANESAANSVRFAEDLVRGYRVDVLDTGTGVWRSLHFNVVNAAAERYGPLPPIAGEGFFSIGLASAAVPAGDRPDPAAELYVPEKVVTWDGWSLSAPRPGRPLAADANNEPVEPPANAPFTTMGLSIAASAVPGTLPRLRFGRSYRLRLREVDFAGNGATATDADMIMASAELGRPDLATAELTYRRYEPVPAPTVVAAQPFQEGSSLLRLVVRSDRAVSADDYAAEFNAEFPRPDPYLGHDDRHLAAPKATYDLAEKHGKFDPAIGADGTGTPSPASLAEVRTAYEIARREKGSFDDPAAPDWVPMEIDAGPPRPGEPPRLPQRYVLRTADQLELPYLPDPLALGLVFFGLPGTPVGSGYEIVFGDLPGADAWYLAQPIRLRFTDRDAAPEWDAAARLLTVGLPPAATARVQVASILRDLDVMAVREWCETELPAADAEGVMRIAKANRCWLLTPWHDLELVHAVQRPLTDPQIADLRAAPADGTTFADLAGLVELHVASTEKFDLEASWTEPYDEPARGVPGVRTGSAQVFELPVRLPASRPDLDPEQQPYTLLDGHIVGFNSARGRERGEPPPAHDFGDTKYRRVRYRVVGTTPFREDFPPDWPTTQPQRLTARSAEVEVEVLSRARPAPPPLRYVIPTLGWERRTDGLTATTVRRGGGLRVWLGRGWWSSGDGELLGVVLSGSPLRPEDPEYPYVSFVAQDPIRAAADIGAAAPEQFRGQAAVGRRLRLPELSTEVTVVGYEVHFDEGTDRWYADLELDTEQAYFPFVRLALVRYQPHSLPDRHLSPVVIADICQTLPDRTATVIRDPADRTVTVTVTGSSYTAIRGVHGVRADPSVAPRIRVVVQQADPAIADPDLRWQPADVGSPVLTPTVLGTDYTWTGQVTTPADGGPFRLLLVEEETLAVDSETDPSELGRRIVYASTFDL